MALRRRHKNTSLSLKHEINVTPFVDVMLVLLIIFMVSAPMMQSDVPVQLPQGAVETQNSEEAQAAPSLVVAMDTQGHLFLHDKPISVDALMKVVQEDQNRHPIYLRADRGLTYQYVMSIMSRLSAVGCRRVHLVLESAS
jgi:biopolymer transport protein TolR